MKKRHRIEITEDVAEVYFNASKILKKFKHEYERHIEHSEIYDNNIIWSNSLLCHDSIVGSHNFIAASSVIGGFSKVLENNFIGFNSVVKENIIIDKEVLIGAKSLVLKSPEDYSVYYGIPAVKIKEHKETGIKV